MCHISLVVVPSCAYDFNRKFIGRKRAFVFYMARHNSRQNSKIIKKRRPAPARHIQHRIKAHAHSEFSNPTAS